MSIVPKNDESTRSNPARRRRKKRRTEDFSDSSDSSSDSSSNSGDESDDANKAEDQDLTQVLEEIDNDGDIVLDESELRLEADKDDFGITKQKLKTVILTKTALNQSTKNIDINQVESILENGRKSLENDYLGLMFENYGEDVNALRSAPDFNQKSLTILANALKNGNNIFDEETLRAVVKK